MYCIDFRDKINALDFHDKTINALDLTMEEEEEGEEVRIKVMRTRVYPKAAAED